ncbi:MAG: alpha-glucuronidase [Lachnospiraceae bacterium]|nr:alpha-glucuronidase [Lachnospiraceae bacterium]
MCSFEKCWLNYACNEMSSKYAGIFKSIYSDFDGTVTGNTIAEIKEGFGIFFGKEPVLLEKQANMCDGIWLKQYEKSDNKAADEFEPGTEGYSIYYDGENQLIVVAASGENGVMYGVFELLRIIQSGRDICDINICHAPKMPIRMIDHWDNIMGDIERGYSGDSFFFKENEILFGDRTKAYARMMASIGINAITINNVNVHEVESYLITDRFLGMMKKYSDLFVSYGIKLYLSVNFASPMQIGGLGVCDPLDDGVIKWWNETSRHVYEVIPEFGGYLVKADSEGRPGPFTYGRTHADGANMLAKSVSPFGGNVVWRCFVYNCKQDWRDRKTDRARAAYDNFAGLDGQFDDNVILQIKNGPMDFQVREPVSPLFGAMKKTNMFLEVQAAQEYTGQQRHICYLVPMWKEILDFDTHASDRGCISEIVSGKAYGNRLCGMAAVTNTGDDANWTGHDFAAANLFGYGMLCFDTERSAQDIAAEWAACTFGIDKEIVDNVCRMLIMSWPAYEKYTSPLGIGWMVNPSDHYGPNVDGYEYDVWGTYHRADCKGVGIDRSAATGTGYAAQYNSPWRELYERVETTPEELLLFFHHISYDHVLSTKKTVIQHIYDTHFEGVEDVERMIGLWKALEGKIDAARFARVLERLTVQYESSKEWRDRINTYFYRMSGIADSKGRTIY